MLGIKSLIATAVAVLVKTHNIPAIEAIVFYGSVVTAAHVPLDFPLLHTHKQVCQQRAIKQSTRARA